MATIKINRKEFEELLGEEVSDQQLKEDASYLGAHWNPIEGKKWEVETYPNRPDLLSVEGLSRAYKGFFGIEKGLVDYKTTTGNTKLRVDQSVEEIRPYIGAAVIRDVELTPRIINGFIQLQEKLHQTVGRRRDKIAIGLHDMEEIEPPFTYKAVEPEQVSFKPLEYDKELHLDDILDEHEKGRKYAWILEDEEKYPIITDNNDKILSFPPIINNQLTEVTSKTTDIFIDVTGKDRETVLKIVNILSTAFAERGGKIETVQIEDQRMPILEPKKKELDINYFRKISGLELDQQEIITRLKKMRYGVKAKNDKILEVNIPSYRTDIMHQYDLIEDIVIAHRYSNIEPKIPELDQMGQQRDIEEFTELLSEILQGTGALETHTFVLSSKDKLFDKMNLETQKIVEMENPLTKDYSVVRHRLLPSMMEVLNENRHRSYPQKFYEIDDVAVLTEDTHTGAKNKRMLNYIVSGPQIDYTNAKEVLQVLERDLGIKMDLEKTDENYCKPERAAKIKTGQEKIGIIGEIDQEVIENWGLENNTATIEIDVEKLHDLVKE